MKPETSPPVLSALLAAAVVLAWCAAALALDQPLFTVQRSRLLMTLGAADGELLVNGQWWRIVTSQFLHVHFLHMLFNAACLGIVGAALERRHGGESLTLVVLVGGSSGQIASVLAYPGLVSSGASQALMALCAAALVLLPRHPVRLFALAVVVIQAALDLYVADRIKAGHGAGFLAGLLLAWPSVRFARRLAGRSASATGAANGPR